MLCLRKCVQALKNVGWSQYYFVGVVDVRVFFTDNLRLLLHRFLQRNFHVFALHDDGAVRTGQHSLNFIVHTLYTLQLFVIRIADERKESKLIS